MLHPRLIPVGAPAKRQPASQNICRTHQKARDMAHLVYQDGGLVCRSDNVCKVSIKDTDQVETCSIHGRTRQKQYMVYDSVANTWHCVAPNECLGAAIPHSQ
uniref:Uncharacterized protein n=2 Tax=Eutreptiella gymnastica TaxID=73025 RepID=A0A7S1JFU7_9EUGL